MVAYERSEQANETQEELEVTQVMQKEGGSVEDKMQVTQEENDSVEDKMQATG
jgi:hypothetical protein